MISGRDFKLRHHCRSLRPASRRASTPTGPNLCARARPGRRRSRLASVKSTVPDPVALAVGKRHPRYEAKTAHTQDTLAPEPSSLPTFASALQAQCCNREADLGGIDLGWIASISMHRLAQCLPCAAFVRRSSRPARRGWSHLLLASGRRGTSLVLGRHLVWGVAPPVTTFDHSSLPLAPSGADRRSSFWSSPLRAIATKKTPLRRAAPARRSRGASRISAGGSRPPGWFGRQGS
jgi:hypothetical protein